jgi:hypothetical protein
MSKRSRCPPQKYKKTPVRAALRSASPLQHAVKDGLGAIKASHRGYFDKSVRNSFADSLDADVALQPGREQENRWDYLLGHQQSNSVIAVEPHSAGNAEISTVIRKLEAARAQLREHLREGVVIRKWLWVASGRVQFAPFDKATIRLAQSGITFAGKKVLAKHLPS